MTCPLLKRRSHGDRGRRYEIRAIRSDGQELVVGWSDDPGAFTDFVRLHPGLKERIVVDREIREPEV